MRPVTVPLGTKVRVYRNLAAQCWSLQSQGLVVGHVLGALLEDCRFIVQPAGQAKVRASGRKQVHAFVEGTLRGWHAHAMGRSCYPTMYVGQRVTYNPYLHDTFVYTDGQDEIVRASWVELSHRGALASLKDPHTTT